MPDGRFARLTGVLLRIPLAGKLAGANAVIVVAAVSATLGIHGDALDAQQVVVLAGALAGILFVNLMLVRLALRPLRDLEVTATRVWEGEFDARVRPSSIADRDLQRIGRTLNHVLDGLIAERARVRRLAAEVIRAGDLERAAIARELHDSAAQSLAALTYQTTAVERENADPAIAEALSVIRQISQDVLEQIRVLSHTVHPRVLDDLGLEAALRKLAREFSARSSADIEVVTEPNSATLSPAVAAVLYRVAQEAVNNAVTHAAASRITVRVSFPPSAVALAVEDDGRGFDVKAAERQRPGMGVFTMRERVALVDGRLEIESTPGRGTRVRATLPVPNSHGGPDGG